MTSMYSYKDEWEGPLVTGSIPTEWHQDAGGTFSQNEVVLLDVCLLKNLRFLRQEWMVFRRMGFDKEELSFQVGIDEMGEPFACTLPAATLPDECF